MKSRILVLLFIVVVLLSGCKASGDTNLSVNLLFSNLYNIENNVKEISSMVKSLDGKKICIKGYMASQSPVDNSFLYLVNMPYMACPFCVITDNTKLEVIPVYNKDNSPVKFTDQPVEIVGTLEISEKTDVFNYTTQFRIYADKITPLVETQEDKLINGYLQQINEINGISTLQVAFFNIDGALFADLFENNEMSDKEIYEVIQSNAFSSYFDEGTKFLFDKIADLEKVKPVNTKLKKAQEDLVNLFYEEADLMQTVSTFITIELTPDIGLDLLINKYKEFISTNQHIYESYILWNNKLREN